MLVKGGLRITSALRLEGRLIPTGYAMENGYTENTGNHPAVAIDDKNNLSEFVLGVYLQYSWYSFSGRGVVRDQRFFTQPDDCGCRDGFQFGVGGTEQPAAPVEIANERHCGCRRRQKLSGQHSGQDQSKHPGIKLY